MRAAGVISNAGLNTAASMGAVGAPKPQRTSSGERCSMTISSPVAVDGSNVLVGAAT